MNLYIDADALPNTLKPILLRAIIRLAVPTFVIANKCVNIGKSKHITSLIVSAGPDEADNRIVELVKAGDLVITADIPLASRCLKAGARVLGPRGRPFTEDSIGDALAGREIQAHLRELGAGNSGPPPFVKQDRSRFLQELDVMIHAVNKGRSS